MKWILLLWMGIHPPNRIAEFTSTPNPSPNSLITFDASPSICDKPCTYLWTDEYDGSQLATGIMFTTTFRDVGIKTIRLTITDTKGQTASVEHDVVVTFMSEDIAKTLAGMTWGKAARIMVMKVYDGTGWTDLYCVGKQEYLPVGVMTPFGALASPRAGDPVQFNGWIQPTWLGCGGSLQAAFMAAKVKIN